jgi:hypothetical protein
VIPKDPSLKNNQKETCNGHQKRHKFYCDECKLSLCLNCLPTHSHHGFSHLESKAKSLISDLHTLEHLTRFLKSSEDSNNTNFDEILDSILFTFEKIQNKSASSVIHFLSLQVPVFFLKIQELSPEFSSLDLLECKKMIEEGREMMKESKKLDWMHWVEWNDRSIHLLNLNTMKKHSILVSSVIPFFCKSASLPYQQIFICGGRLESASPGLKSAFIVHLAEDCRVERLPDMEVGRSNHCVIYFKNFVYVLVGCNELNQYTNKCERLKIPDLKWERIASCPEVVDTCSVTALDNSNFLFMTGGRLNSQSLTSSIHRFDVVSNFWKKLSVKIPIETSVHGSCFLNSQELLIFAGQDKNSNPLFESAVVNIETGEAQVSEVKMTRGGCIVNECRTWRNKVFFFVFQGFCSRILQSFEISTKSWVLEDLY